MADRQHIATWRDTASAQAQHDLDDLLNAVLTFAREQVDKRGTFLPFRGAVDTAGALRLTAAETDRRAGLDPAAMLESLYAAASAEEADFRAVAFAADAKLGRDDAVLVELEHREGIAVQVSVPYHRVKGRSVQLRRPLGAPATAHVW